MMKEGFLAMILMKTMMEISQESRWQKSGYYLEILHSHLGGWIYLLLMSFLIRKLGLLADAWFTWDDDDDDI